MPGWLLRCGFVAAALLPVLLGAPAALIMWLLIPVAVECCRVVREQGTCIAALAVLVGASGWVLSQDVWALCLVWGVTSLILLMSRETNHLRRSLVWTGATALMLCAVLAWLGGVYQGEITYGLADALVWRLYGRENAEEWLLRCWQMGLCSLEDELALAVRLLGRLALSEEVRLQLLYSLRTTVKTALDALLPQASVAWLLLTLVLTTAVPDIFRRKRGERGVLPSFGEWQLSQWAHRQLNALVIVYLICLMAAHPVAATLGSMCAAAFQYTYMLLGMAVLEGMGKRRGTVKAVRRLWMAGCIIFAPFILLILGVADRGLDLRQLRRLTDDKGGKQQ